MVDFTSGQTFMGRGHESVIRAVLYHEPSQQFVTAGEDSAVFSWRPEALPERREVAAGGMMKPKRSREAGFTPY